MAKKWVKILIVQSFRLKFDDVTVTLSLIVFSLFFYKLILILFYFMPNLLRLNVIFMVKKIGQLLLNGGARAKPAVNKRAVNKGVVWTELFRATKMAHSVKTLFTFHIFLLPTWKACKFRLALRNIIKTVVIPNKTSQLKWIINWKCIEITGFVICCRSNCFGVACFSSSFIFTLRCSSCSILFP